MKNRNVVLIIALAGIAVMMSSCRSIPKKAEPINNFKVDRYLGTWYEIARFDYLFEKNMDNASAQYSLNADGSVKVINSGYNYKKEKWSKVEGKAKFRGNESVAALKVSFFGPFYSGYNVIALDDNYRYALVAGKNLNYLWILSREKTIPDNVKDLYLKIAREIGYDVNKLIWVKQDRENPYASSN